MDPFTWLFNFMQNNPMLVMMLLYMMYKKYQSSQPWPDFGGRVTSLHSLAEWEELLKSNSGKVVVVDAYATWCPPCKAAAPKYAELSEKFSADSTLFVKFNTDEATDLARQLEISAMPTFKVFKSGVEVDVMRGWAGEAKLAEILKKHGGKEEGAAAARKTD